MSDALKQDDGIDFALHMTANSSSLSDERNGSAHQNAIDFLRLMIRHNADPEMLHIHTVDTHTIHERDTLSPIDDVKHCFVEAIGIAMRNVIDREADRSRILGARKVWYATCQSRKARQGDVMVKGEDMEVADDCNELSDEDSAIDEREKGRSSVIAVGLKNVIRSGNQKGRHACETCGKSYTAKNSLNEHKRSHQKDEAARRPYKCNDCAKRFTSAGALKRHEHLHLPDNAPLKNKYRCKICGRCETSTSALARHARKHMENEKERRPHECVDCGKRFATATQLKAHLNTHLPVDDPRKLEFVCEICNKIFKSGGGLHEHKRSHQTDERAKFPFECQDCGKRFMRAGTLQVHSRQHMSADDPRRIFECEICGRRLTENGLRHHRKTHLDENDPEQAKIRRPFKCDECDKPVEKPHKCDECGKRFSTRKVLKAHNMIHLPDDQRQKFTCNVCGKALISAKYLKVHELLHIDPESARAKPFKCAECAMAFTAERALTLHMNYHTGNFPFTCDICSKGFNNEALMSKHKEGHEKGTRLHTGRTKLCHICPRRFRQAFELAVHLKRHQEGTVGDSTDDDVDEKPLLKTFICKVCGIKYVDYSTLKYHIKTKHKDRAPELLPRSFFPSVEVKDKENIQQKGTSSPLICGSDAKQSKVQEHIQSGAEIEERKQ